MSESLKSKAISGIIWSTIERFSAQGLQFIVMIIMARLLMPNDYGLIGMLAIFMAIAQSLVDSGFSSALIRKINCSEDDYSTVFFFNIGIGFILFVILFFLAPYISIFYENKKLDILTKVISLNIFINSLSVVQRAILTRRLDFKTQAKASFIAVFISGIAGIILAFRNFGVWALVFQGLIFNIINTVLLWVFSRWFPQFIFSMISFRNLFSFGSKLLMSGLIEVVYMNLYTITIGKCFSVSDVGYFTRADNFSQFPSTNIMGIVQRVTFPIFSQMQKDKKQLTICYRRFVRLVAYIIFPLMIGLTVVAYPFIEVLLGSEWKYTAVLLQILCLSYMWYPIHAINLNLLEVYGRSDLYLKLQIIKKIIGVVILIVTIPYGLVAICYSLVFSSYFALIINSYYTYKLLDFGFLQQIKDLLIVLTYSLIMGVFVHLVILYFDNPIYKLFLGSLSGLLVYFTISVLLKSRELRELYLLIKRK